MISLLLIVALLVREALFRLGPPALGTLVVLGIVGAWRKPPRGRRLTVAVFAWLLLLWNLIVIMNPAWTAGWYHDTL